MVDGGAGKDTVVPDEDSTPDTYRGGADIDTASFRYYQDSVTVSLDGGANDGANCPQQCEGDNVTGSLENLTGSYESDHLTGSGGANVIDAGSGDNVIDGAGGADILSAGYGEDSIQGGGGDDALFGGYGDDSLDGGADTDECRGDDGTDTALNCETEFGIP